MVKTNLLVRSEHTADPSNCVFHKPTPDCTSVVFQCAKERRMAQCRRVNVLKVMLVVNNLNTAEGEVGPLSS